jgi:cell division FtsZ-interacting protein ZapD
LFRSLKEQLEQLKGPENQGRRIEILRQIRDVDQQILDTLREDTARVMKNITLIYYTRVLQY